MLRHGDFAKRFVPKLPKNDQNYWGACFAKFNAAIHDTNLLWAGLNLPFFLLFSGWVHCVYLENVIRKLLHVVELLNVICGEL